MVSGINTKNYTAAQLEELKNAGVQISDKDIAAAKKLEAQNKADKASDEEKMKYTINDDASKTNEAEQEVKTAGEYGTNLKGILTSSEKLLHTGMVNMVLI